MHVCPSVPVGTDCVVYVEACKCGHECGVETTAGRRLRHEFTGKRSLEQAASHAEWVVEILKRYCRVGEVLLDNRCRTS